MNKGNSVTCILVLRFYKTFSFIFFLIQVQGIRSIFSYRQEESRLFGPSVSAVTELGFCVAISWHCVMGTWTQNLRFPVRLNKLSQNKHFLSTYFMHSHRYCARLQLTQKPSVQIFFKNWKRHFFRRLIRKRYPRKMMCYGSWLARRAEWVSASRPLLQGGFMWLSLASAVLLPGF